MANDTRWSSMHLMLESIISMFDEIQTVCVKNKKKEYIDCIDFELLDAVVRLLLPFKMATLAFEVNTEPTIDKVLLYRLEIIKHLEEKQENEVDCLKNIKECLLEELQNKWHVDDIHVAGALLDPVQKNKLSKLGLTEEQIKSGLNFVIKVIVDNFEETASPPAAESSSTQTPVSQLNHPAKKFCFSSIIKNFADEPENLTLEQKVNRELSSYIDLSFETELDNHKVLNFWKKNANQFKYLSFAAKCIFSVPASSAKSESDFSIAGRTKTKQRSSLSPSTLESLLLIRENKDLIKINN